MTSSSKLEDDFVVVLDNIWFNYTSSSRVDLVMHVDKIYSDIVNNTDTYWSYAVVSGNPIDLTQSLSIK